MGAKVIGYALAPDETNPSLFNILNLNEKIVSIFADVRDSKTILHAIKRYKPDIIFHLAAQALVRESYQNPIYNYETNIMGTVNLLEAAKEIQNLKAIVNITTDKCYENQEQHRPYIEADKLGGHDPYSASKACSEIITSSYRKSFYSNLGIGLASARAGNVIGGGDFAKDRIIPDIISSIQKNEIISLRNPNAIRPWQHVFDALNGYMLLAKNLYEKPEDFSQAYNFSPIDKVEIRVIDIVQKFISVFGKGSYKVNSNRNDCHEAQLLNLDCQKAVSNLKWYPQYDINKTIFETVNWYKNYLDKNGLEEYCYNRYNDYFHNYTHNSISSIVEI